MENFIDGGFHQGDKIQGVVIGIVVDNKHPEGEYRVKVKFPWIKESDSKYTDSPDKEDFLSNWARIATFMGGPDRGSFWLPEVDDEVLVAFEHGDIRRPFVLAALWNGKDKTIHDNESQGGENNWRTIRSRSGHVLQFYDKEGEDKIIMQTKTAVGECPTDHHSRTGHFIAMDCSSGAEKIEIYDGPQKNYLLIDSTNNQITMESKEGNITIKAPQGKVLIDCKQLETKSSDTTTMNSTAAMKVNGSATIDVIASSVQTIKGSLVKIN